MDGDRLGAAVAGERRRGAEHVGGVDAGVTRDEADLELVGLGECLASREGDDLERGGVEAADGELEGGDVGAELREQHGRGVTRRRSSRCGTTGDDD